MMFRKLFYLIFSLSLLISCSQEPARIVYKGQNFYDQKNVPQSIIALKVERKSDSNSKAELNEGNTEAKQKKSEEKKEEKAKKKSFFSVFKAKMPKFGSAREESDTKQNKLKNVDIIKVKPGDTLYQIARDNKTPVRNIIEANKLKPPYILYPGDDLYLPKEKNTHIVQKGETLSAIASNYNVSVNAVMSLNDISDPNKIGVGTILVLPYSADNSFSIGGVASATGKKVKNIFGSSVGFVKDKVTFKKKDKVEIAAKKDFIYPVKGKIILDFSEKKENGAKNDGINIAAKKGSAVKASAAGKIVYVGNALKGYGNLIIIKHKNNFLTAYAHNEEVYVRKNQKVKQGEKIAAVGNTGNVNRSQLYFGLRKGKKPLNPKPYLE